MELEGLVLTNKGLVPLYSLKVGDKYQIMDSQCYAKVVMVETLKWPDSRGYNPVTRLIDAHKPAILVSYEAYFPDGRLVHGNPGKYIQVVEAFDKMVKIRQ
jgi:hypothetical protein